MFNANLFRSSEITDRQRALSDQPWKEYTAEGGRKYWYNTETKQSIWEMPAVYMEALEKQAPPAAFAQLADALVNLELRAFLQRSHSSQKGALRFRLDTCRRASSCLQCWAMPVTEAA